MKRKHTPALFEPSEADVQQVAYRLWVESGQVSGRDLDNWLTAKDLLRHRHSLNLEGTGRRRRVSLTPEIPSGGQPASKQTAI